jgi:hypothetical protein
VIIWRSRIWFWLLIKKSIKKILVQARRIEGIAAASMRQREPGRGTDIGLGDLAAPLPGRMGSRRSCGHDVGSHAVDLKGPADPGDGGELPIIEAYRWQQRAGSDDLGPKFIFTSRIVGNEGCRITIERDPTPNHFCSQLGIARSGYLYCQPEAIKQLWPQLTFLGIHRSDQDQPGGVGN